MYLSGILLAGGASSRFKSNKLRSSIGPIPLYANQLIKLLFFCEEVIISTNTPGSYFLTRDIKRIGEYLTLIDPSFSDIGDKEITIVTDKQAKGINRSKKGIGPILGLYNGLDRIKGDRAIVTAFDMPLISYLLLDTFRSYAFDLSDKEAAIIKGSKGFESLCGVYSKMFSDRLRQNINRGEFKISLSYNNSCTKIINIGDLYPLGIDDLNFFNVNKEEDLRNFFKIFYGEVDDDDAGSDNSRFIRKWKDYFYRKTDKAIKYQET